MVEAIEKVGPKGHILIPKLLRDEYGLRPGEEVMLSETGDGLIIRKHRKLDILEVAQRISKAGPVGRIGFHEVEEEIEERMKRAGVRV